MMHTMKHRLIRTGLLLSLLCGASAASADEGMWLVSLLSQIEAPMRARGLELPVEALWNPEGGALCDAVVAVDGGMGTGSMISGRGLMITNHHVAYSDICALSTPENNYLENGFWARSEAEELPVPGKRVAFLRGVEDVTAEAVARREAMQAAGRWSIMGGRRLAADMEAQHAREGLEAACVAMWGGERYLLFYYEVFTDVRLVAAPPVRIGAFGGETDNWGWPQHKGDFALYRVYGDAEGAPADYAPGNRPVVPRRVLTVSTQGVHDGDFTMVIGYPGRTRRYGSSFAEVEKREVKNPIIEKGRHDRMDILRRRMEADSLVRLAYSDNYFSLSNYADYARWENICLGHYGVRAVRAAEEAAMAGWIAADTGRKQQWGSLLAELERGYAARREAERVRTWFQEAWLTPSHALIVANRVASALLRLEKEGVDTVRVGTKSHESLLSAGASLATNYDAATDRELLVHCQAAFLREVPRTMWGEALAADYDRCAGDAEKLLGEAFDASFCRDAAAYASFFAGNRSLEELRDDPLVRLAASVGIRRFSDAVRLAEQEAGLDVSDLEARFRHLQYLFREAEGRAQYPDANSTMRLSYGRVGGLSPVDGVRYAGRSTAKGILEKADASNYDFRVDERLREGIEQGAWGAWGEEGQMIVNFVSDNDITGGNSGSPILNGRGELVGLAFDGNRESMAGDLWFHPAWARTVSVDIRYVLWLIEHYGGARYLLDEMTLAGAQPLPVPDSSTPKKSRKDGRKNRL